MGLLSDVLLFPVTGPVRGLAFIAAQIKEQVDAELDPRRRAEKVQAELMRLSMRHDLGQISEDEYAAQEAALLAQLNALWAEIRGDTEDVGSS
jgi:hypothetical protein